MSNKAILDLINQYQRTFTMLDEEIERFDDQQWLKGLSHFLTPVSISMHIFDTLDYYFCGKASGDYHWGYHFGGGWWELPEGRLPDQEAVLQYGHKAGRQAVDYLEALEDVDLSHLFPIDNRSGMTELGHAVYALRHTVHHHGELAALAVFHGLEGGSWA